MAGWSWPDSNRKAVSVSARRLNVKSGRRRFLIGPPVLQLIQKQLEVLREYIPPPNASIIELLNDFCRASVLCVDNVAVLPGFGS